MAKIEFTAIVSQITGRLSGSVFQRSVGGNQLRSIGWGVNRRTINQQANRVALEYLASNWRNLTDAQRATWTGVTGQERFTNFVAQNQEYAWLSQSLHTTPVSPSPAPVPEPDTLWYAQHAGSQFFIGGGLMPDQTYAFRNQWFVELTVPSLSLTTPGSETRRFKGLDDLAATSDQVFFSLNTAVLGFNMNYAEDTALRFRIVVNKGSSRGETPWIDVTMNYV